MPRLSLRIPLLAAAGLLLAGPLLPAQSTPSADDFIGAGDALAATNDDQGALAQYATAERMEPNNSGLLLKIAKQYRLAAIVAPDKKDKLRYGYTALEYAKRAQAVDPKNAETHLAVAIGYGKLMPFLGSKDQVQSQAKLKAAVDQSLILNPDNDIAWHVLGRWHQVLCDVKGVRRSIGGMLYGALPTTTPEAAAKCFEKAIALNPARPRHYIELGRTLALMGKDVDAKQMINKGLAMPNVDRDDAEIKAKGRETLAKLN